MDLLFLRNNEALQTQVQFVSVEFIYTMQTQVQFASVGNEALRTLGKSLTGVDLLCLRNNEALRTLGKEF